MTKNLFYLTILLAFFSPKIICQTISSQKGLTTIVFKSNYGSIKVYLPENIQPGEIISGSVVTMPAGDNAKQQKKAIDRLLKSKLHIGNPDNPKSVSNKFEKLYPERISLLNKINVTFPFLVSLTDADGKTQSIELPQPEPVNQVKNCITQTHAQTGALLPIKGPFDGDAANTQCSLNGKEMEILAESPRQCFVNFPKNVTGKAELKITENGKEQCKKQIQSVHMDLLAGKLNLLKGEKTTIDVKITGLEGIKDSASLKVTNQTKDVVQMADGNEQLIFFSPTAYKANNTYTKTFVVQSTRTGNFDINFSLQLPDGPPIIFADNNGANVGGVKLHPLPVKGVKNGMKDAFEKAYVEFTGNTGNKYPELDDCGSCISCIRTMLGEDIVALVGDIAKILTEHYVDLLSSGAGGALAWIKDKYDKLEKAEDIASAIADAVSKGELQIVEFKERLCGYCLVSAIGFYDAKTKCMDAFFYCKGSKLCCLHALTIIHLKYCVNDDGYKTPESGLAIDIIAK